jgi:hypothetical protein
MVELFSFTQLPAYRTNPCPLPATSNPRYLRLPSISRDSLCSQNMHCGEGIYLIQADVNLKYHKEEDMQIMEFGVCIFVFFYLVRILIKKKCI